MVAGRGGEGGWVVAGSSGEGEQIIANRGQTPNSENGRVMNGKKVWCNSTMLLLIDHSSIYYATILPR